MNHRPTAPSGYRSGTGRPDIMPVTSPPPDSQMTVHDDIVNPGRRYTRILERREVDDALFVEGHEIRERSGRDHAPRRH